MTPTIRGLSLCLLFFQTGFGPCSAPPQHAEVATPPQQAAAAEPAEERARERPPQQTKTTPAFMREHSSDALALREAVIAGRFDQIHRVAAVIAEDGWSPNLRADYVPHVNAMRDAARRALDARSVQAAGGALGALGDACAACHREHGGPPQPAPEPRSSGVGPMAVHAAAERALWEGLFTPSELSWKRGAQNLASAPELTSDVVDVAVLADQVNDLAREAAKEGPRGERYGGIVATCSTCHRRLNVEPH